MENRLFNILKFDKRTETEWYSRGFMVYYNDRLKNLDYSCKKEREKARGLLTDYKWNNKVDDYYVESKFINDFVNDLDSYEEELKWT